MKVSPDGRQAWCKQCSKANQQSNKKTTNIKTKKWRQAHPETYRHSQEQWKIANQPAVRAACAKRRAARRNALSIWADKEVMLQFYKEAQCRSIETGVPYEVDHVVPLISKRKRALIVPELGGS